VKRHRQSPSGSEAGFALLFVYAMAATVAIMLLLQIPSAAFEAQRNREQLLIDRGEQYSRAIQLYVRKFNRYPADFDALDSTQNMRFLRHHYEDPLTGKEDWRLIHVGPGGVFLDSLLNKKKDTSQGAPQTFITEVPMVQDATAAPGGVNIATRRTGVAAAYNPNDPNSPLPGQAPLPGQSGYPGVQSMPSSFPGASFPGTMVPGQPGQLPDPNQTLQIPGGVPSGTQLPPGMQIPGQNGQTPGSSSGGAATSMINQLLTTPRPGGLGGLTGGGAPQSTVDAFGNPVQSPAAAGNTGQPVAGQAAAGTIGGGIAGIASKVEEEGIKRYRDRKLYNEWEFVYDVTKDSSRAGTPQQQQGGAAGTAGGQGIGGAQGAAGTAMSGTTAATPAGTMPATTTTPPIPGSTFGSTSSAGSTSDSISIFPSIGSAPAQPTPPAQPTAPAQPVAPVLPGLTPTPGPGPSGAAPATPGLPPGLTLPPGLPVPGAPPPQQ
jgi:hypothetical protein